MKKNRKRSTPHITIVSFKYSACMVRYCVTEKVFPHFLLCDDDDYYYYWACMWINGVMIGHLKRSVQFLQHY